MAPPAPVVEGAPVAAVNPPPVAPKQVTVGGRVKMARLIASLPGCSLLPFQGSMGVGTLAETREGELQ